MLLTLEYCSEFVKKKKKVCLSCSFLNFPDHNRVFVLPVLKTLLCKMPKNTFVSIINGFKF